MVFNNAKLAMIPVFFEHITHGFTIFFALEDIGDSCIHVYSISYTGKVLYKY